MIKLIELYPCNALAGKYPHISFITSTCIHTYHFELCPFELSIYIILFCHGTEPAGELKYSLR